MSDSFDPMDCRSSSSSVHGIFQARIMDWVAIPSSRGSFRPRDWTHIPYVSWLLDGFFTTSTTWETHMYTHIHTHTTPSHIPFFFQTHTAEVPLGKTSNLSLVYLDRGQIYSDWWKVSQWLIYQMAQVQLQGPPPCNLKYQFLKFSGPQ